MSLPLLLWLWWFVKCADACRVEVLGSSLAHYLEPAYLRLIQVDFGWHLDEVLVPSDEDVWQRAAEVCTVKIRSRLDAATTALMLLVLLDHVNLLALWTENLDPAASQLLAEANR